MTDRASAEGLKPCPRCGLPHHCSESDSDPVSAEGLREALESIAHSEPVAGSWQGWREVRRLRDIATVALHGTGPRPDSDPWPDLDGSEGPWRDDQGYWLGGMGTPDTEPRSDRLALIHRPVTNPMYPRPICEDDGQEWPCKTAIVARLSTPHTETSDD